MCRAKLDKLPSPTSTQPTASSSTTDSHMTKSADSHTTKSHDKCRLQVRLPSGKVLRRVFSSESQLCEVVEFVRASGECDSVRLVQVGRANGWGLMH